MKITSLLYSDNYIHVISDAEKAIVVDPSAAGPVLEFLNESHLELTHVLITHHHADHTAGCAKLKKQTGCKLVGPVTRSTPLAEEDLPPDTEVIRTPGHTSTHLCYYLPKQKALFSGDTLFLGGCGRLFEGTASQMWDSLVKLRGLPSGTNVYPGHDYTLDNLEFCQSILTDNPNITERLARLRVSGSPDHATLDMEIATNVFLMCDTPIFQEATGLSGNPEDIFGDLRQRKDSW